MIEFTGRINGAEALLIRVENNEPDGMADPARGSYSVQVAVRSPDGWDKVYQRHLSDFPRLEKNLLGMIEELLLLLPEEAFTCDPSTSPADLARRLPRTMPALPPGSHQLRDH